VEDCPNKTKPKDMKKARRVRMQALTTIKTWDDSSSQEEAHHKGRRPQVFIELFAHLPHHGTLWTAFASWKKVKLKPSGGGCWQQAQTVLGACNGCGQEPPDPLGSDYGGTSQQCGCRHTCGGRGRWMPLDIKVFSQTF